MAIKDIALNADNDIEIGYNGDLKVCRDMDVLVQDVLFRLKTVQGDWVLEPECGADLETMLGQPNTRVTGTVIERMVWRALTHDGVLDGIVRDVRVVPINTEQVEILITLGVDEERVTVMQAVDLTAGLI